MLCLVLSGQVRASFGASRPPKLSRPCKYPLKTRLEACSFRVSVCPAAQPSPSIPLHVCAGEGREANKEKSFLFALDFTLFHRSLVGNGTRAPDLRLTAFVRSSGGCGGCPCGLRPLDTLPLLAALALRQCPHPPPPLSPHLLSP